MIAKALLFAAMATVICLHEVKASDEEKALQLICSPELKELADNLAGDFSVEYPGWQIRVTTGTAGEMNGILREGAIAMVNKEDLAGMDGEYSLRCVVGRDAIIPVINANNPHAATILQHGISPESFRKICNAAGKVTWGEVTGTPDPAWVRAYLPVKESSRAYLAGFTGTETGKLGGEALNEPEAIIGRIREDNYALGFCSLACLSNLETEGIIAGINLVPVDVDGNGQVDQFEDIYRSCSSLSHGIFVGKFPRALYSRIYAVSAEKPLGETGAAFLEWVLNGGQESLAAAGIMTLGHSERTAGIHLVANSQKLADASVPVTAKSKALLWTGIFVILGICVLLVIFRLRRTRAADLWEIQAEPGLFGEDSVVFPEGLYFDKSHTWTFMEKDGNVRVGIDDFLQHVTGSITRVMIMKPGMKIARGETLVTLVQNGKQLEIKSPVTGTVVQQNLDLIEDASPLNSDPFSGGWVCMVKPANWITELGTYLMGENYMEWLKAEFTRLKDFLSSGLKIKGDRELSVVLQDGGEIRDGVLEELGPGAWEEFQTGFINTSN